jgi:hypothetical protein
MQITCINCKQTWEVYAGHLLVARIRFGLGFVEHTFICPNCQAKNVIPATEFEASDHPSPLVPVTGDQKQLDIQVEHAPPRAANDGASAPTNPEPGPRPTSRQMHAVVLERGLPLLRDHVWTAETMDTLSKGERITIVDSWTDGEHTWVQLGPERWALIEEDGNTRIELLDE